MPQDTNISKIFRMKFKGGLFGHFYNNKDSFSPRQKKSPSRRQTQNSPKVDAYTKIGQN